jgi:hypothetical protein
MKHIKTFESFVNESEATKINEGAGDVIAKDYAVFLVSELDLDGINLGDDAVDTLDKILKSNKYGGNSKVYMTNKIYVEDEGKSWDDLVKAVKSKNVKYDLIEDPETSDTILLFAR